MLNKGDANSVLNTQAQEGREELLHVQGQEGRREDISLVQGKEQLLRFAGEAMKRPYVQGKRSPSKTVGAARGHQRADTETILSEN